MTIAFLYINYEGLEDEFLGGTLLKLPKVVKDDIKI